MEEALILAIETSCDETAVALTQGNKIITSLVSSQVKEHQPYGGVVPELASRKHVTALNYLIDKALHEASADFKDINAVAVCKGPGLVGALMVGMAAAKSLALVLNVPLLAINHLEAHIFSVIADNPWLKTPFICLIVSGGHTMLVNVQKLGQYKLLGQTLDDAAGEAFDKVAKFIGLPYPGGPQIEKQAKAGDENRYVFPRPMLKSKDYNFSFSGLKTALIYFIRDLKKQSTSFKIEDIAASFQKAVADVLVEKTFKAAGQFGVKTVVIVGGVSSNKYLRERFIEQGNNLEIKVALPSRELSTDNAAMIGLAANFHYIGKDFSDLSESIDPNLRLV